MISEHSSVRRAASTVTRIAALAAVFCAAGCDMRTSTSAHRVSTATPSPTTGPHVTWFTLPADLPPVTAMSVGPDGNLWLTASRQIEFLVPDQPPPESYVARATTGGDVTFTFSLPNPGANPVAIVAGPDGALWVAEVYGNAVARVTTQGQVTEYPVPPTPAVPPGSGPNSQPGALAVGPDGDLWLTDLGDGAHWRLTPAGHLTEYPLPAHGGEPARPWFGLATGPDGGIWFTDGIGRIGRFDPATGAIVEYPLPDLDQEPSFIVAAHDGNLWFVVPNESLVGRISPRGAIAEFPLPHAPCYMPGVDGSNGEPCQVDSLAVGPGGTVWFGERWRGAVGRVDASGAVTEYTLPPAPGGSTDVFPLGLGPDGALWLAADGALGRFVP